MKTVLTPEDKKLVKNALLIRMLFGVIFIVPLLVFGIYFLVDFLSASIDGNSTIASGFYALLSLGFFYAIWKFVFPFHKKIIRNCHRTEKIIARARITEVSKLLLKQGYSFHIKTDYLTIESWRSTVLKLELPYPEMKVDMILEIHYFEDDVKDLIRIGLAK